MLALVTGANGFLGTHLVRYLVSTGASVVRVVRSSTGDTRTTEMVLGTDRWAQSALSEALARIRPDVVFHLAGASRAVALEALYEANLFLTKRLLDAAAQLEPCPVVVVLGSAAEYGHPHTPGDASRETDPCLPISAYGIAKHAQTLQALAHARQGQPIVVARLFNPVGAGMPSGLALSDFARQILRGETTLRTGNLDVARDFINVGDAARAVVELSECPLAQGRVTNVCAGYAQNLRGLLERMIRIADRRVRIETDRLLFRAADVPLIYGDTHRIRALGIRAPSGDLTESLNALMGMS